MTTISRRTLLRTTTAAATGTLLTGCLSSSPASEPQQVGAKSAGNPFGVKPDAELEVVIFKGGYDERFATEIHQPLYRQQFPNARIRHTATPDIATVVQPRFAGGNPPDVLQNSGDAALDVNALVGQGALHPLDEMYDAPSFDDPGKKVRDTLIPGATDNGNFNGRQYEFNYGYNTFGFWYDAALFRKHGWEYPKTWDGFVALANEIRRAGIAPFTYPGKNLPRYVNTAILCMAAKTAGLDILKAIDNLEPNAWRHPAIRQAAEAFHRLVADRHVLPGSLGLDHVQSQTEWSKGRAAFVVCGSWLENEQKAVTPRGFEMTVMPFPSLTSGDKLPFEAVRGFAGEPFVVPAKAANRAGALEYLRLMLSKDAARRFTEMVSTLTVVQGAAEKITAPGLRSAATMLKQAGPNVFNWRYPAWYPSMEKKQIGPVTGELLANRITPDQWVSQVQKIADKLAKNPDVVKQKR